MASCSGNAEWPTLAAGRPLAESRSEIFWRLVRKIIGTPMTVCHQVQVPGRYTRPTSCKWRELCDIAQQAVSSQSRFLPRRCHKGEIPLHCVCVDKGCHVSDSVGMAALPKGGHLPVAGVQAGAGPTPRRSHPAALHPHVLRQETLCGFPQQDHRTAGAVSGLPHKVSSRLFQTHNISCVAAWIVKLSWTQLSSV